MEREKQKLKEELEACKNWRELHEFLQKRKMGFWLKPGTRPDEGGCREMNVLGIKFSEKVDNDAVRKETQHVTWRKDPNDSDVVRTKVVEDLGRKCLADAIKSESKEGKAIGEVIIDEIWRVRTRRQEKAVACNAGQAVLSETFGFILGAPYRYTQLYLPRELTKEFIRQRWGNNFFERVTDVSIDTEGGARPCIVSVSATLPIENCSEANYACFSFLTITDEAINELGTRLAEVFDRRPIFCWGGEERSLFREVNVVDIQTREESGGLVSLIKEMNRCCGNDGPFRKDVVTTRKRYYDDWSANYVLLQDSIAASGIKKVKDLYLAGFSHNKKLVELCVADTLAILKIRSGSKDGNK